MISEVYNIDCMEGMKQYHDNYFDMAVVDPPYGINADIKNSQVVKYKSSAAYGKSYGDQRWDANIPSEEYFKELFRISKKQIIWGGNYFGLVGGYLYWHKNVPMPTYSTGELAWLSWLTKIDFVDITWNGMIQENMKNKEIRIHPTQKPVSLYLWLYNKYLPMGGKVIDTYLGSGSNRIAADKRGNIDFIGYELDTKYFLDQEKRFSDYKSQTTLNFE